MRQHQRIRRAKLQGEQLAISFPRRGRPSRFRRLERAGQMRLDLQSSAANSGHTKIRISEPDTIEQALDYLFPVGPMTEDELAREFDRLFPLD